MEFKSFPTMWILSRLASNWVPASRKTSLIGLSESVHGYKVMGGCSLRVDILISAAYMLENAASRSTFDRPQRHYAYLTMQFLKTDWAMVLKLFFWWQSTRITWAVRERKFPRLSAVSCFLWGIFFRKSVGTQHRPSCHVFRTIFLDAKGYAVFLDLSRAGRQAQAVTEVASNLNLAHYLPLRYNNKTANCLFWF